MTKKIDILIQEPHTRFGDHAQPLEPGYTYTVEDTPLIQDYITEGFVTDVSAKAEEVDEKPKNSKKQETALDSEETSNG